CAFDIGAGTCMAAVEKQHAGPDVHRLLVAPREVVIESREEELLDTRIAIADGTWVDSVAFVGACGIGHQIRETLWRPGKGHGPDYSAVPARRTQCGATGRVW